MPTTTPSRDTPSRELHQHFMAWGFDPIPSANAYSGMVSVAESTREQEVRIVFTEDRNQFHLQSVVEPHGIADSLTVDASTPCALEGLEVEVSDRVALHSECFLTAEAKQNFSEVLHQVMRIARHADSAAQEAREGRIRFQELLGLVGRQFDATDELSQPDLRLTTLHLREMLDLNPNRDLWALLLGGAGKNALRFWSEGDGDMADEPWDRVAEFLTAYGKRHGWELA